MMSRDELRRYRRGWLKVPGSSSSGLDRPTDARDTREGRRDLRAHPREGPREGLPHARAGRTSRSVARSPGRYIACTLTPSVGALRAGMKPSAPTAAVRAGDPLSRISPPMRIPLLAALTVVLLAPAALAQTRDALSSGQPAPHARRRHRARPTEQSRSISRRRTARRTADASVRSAQGCAASLRRRELRHALSAGRTAGVQRPVVQQQLRRHPVELWAQPELSRQQRDVREPEGRRREPRCRRCGHHRRGRAAARGGHAAVSERAAGAGARGAAGHAREDGAEPARAGAGEARRRLGDRRSTSAAPRWRSARRRSRGSRRATTSRSRSSASSSSSASRSRRTCR